MSHPTTLIKDTSYITEFRTYDPENPGQAKAPDSLPTATVYKNGTANGDSVTIALISTGLYKLTYNPAGEVEGDFFAIDINAVISSVNYPEIINFVVQAVERGTDSSPTAVAIRTEIDSNSTQLVAILNRIGAFTGSGVNTILGFLRAIMRSDASVPSDVGGTFTSSTDSLEAIAEDIGTIAPAELVVAATAAVLTAIDEGGNVQVRRGDRVSFGITGLGSLSGRTGEKLFFTVKTSKTNDLTDANAILQITETSSCVLVNGAAPGAASDATLTVDDATSGDITIILKSAVTNELTVGSRMFYDVQMIRSDGEPVTLAEGRFEVVADVTRRESL